MQVIEGKTTRRVEAIAIGGPKDGFRLVAVTSGVGEKQTLLITLNEGESVETVRRIAEAQARALEHATGYKWAYPGCDGEEYVGRNRLDVATLNKSGPSLKRGVDFSDRFGDES